MPVNDQNFLQYERRLLDEGFWGADYLVRLKNPNGSFYRSISAHGTNNPEDRQVAGEMKSFGLTQSTSGDNQIVERADTEHDYETSFRSGGGIAIAALAKASTYPISARVQEHRLPESRRRWLHVPRKEQFAIHQ